MGHVPVIRYHRPGDPRAAAEVGKIIQRYAADGIELRAVMLERLGPNVWHGSPAQAMATLGELEETARLCSGGLTSPEPLDAAQLESLRQQFGAHW